MTISNIDSKILWARAGGMCSNPSCRIDLTVTLEQKRYLIGEMAHIIAKNHSGPRGTADVSNNTYNNLILLCPTCHTIIDKAPIEDYPIETLNKWKNEIETIIRTKIPQPNNAYRLFVFSNDIFCFDFNVNFINDNEFLCSKEHKEHTYNMLIRAKNNLFYLHGYNENILYDVENIIEKYYQGSAYWYELCQLSQKLLVKMDYNFRSDRDIKSVNTARYYAQTIKNSALEMDSSLSISNFKSSLFSLLYENFDSVIDSILNNIKSNNFESELHQRVSYLLRTIK